MLPTISHRLVASLLAAAALVLALPARGALDVGALNGDRVRGSLAPASEIETFHIDVPRGAAFDVRATAARGGVGVLVTGPDGALVGSDAGQRAAVRGERAALSGEHLVQVGTLDGVTVTDYRLEIRWRGQSTFTERPTISAAQATTVAIPAERGARVTVTVAPAAGSGAQPSFSSRASPGTETIQFPPSRRHRFAAQTTGDHLLTLGDAGDAGGEVIVSARVRPPRARARSCSATTREIPADANVVAAAVLDARGGRVDWPEDLAGAGTSVTLPARALRRPTLVALARGPDLAAPSPELSSIAGPAAVVCPVGTRLPPGRAATLVVPYREAPPDPVRATLRLLRHLGGPDEARLLTGVTLDATAQTASIATPRFGTFQPFFVAAGTVGPGFRVDGEGAEGLGNSVAIAGDCVLLGAPNADGPGPASMTTASGRVRILERVDGSWVERTSLRSFAPDEAGLFGTSVATWYDAFHAEWTAAVGAPGESLSEDPAAGVVHLYALRDGVWIATGDIAGPAGFQGFGSLVRRDGDTVVATAFVASAGPPDVIGEGYPFVFRRDRDLWTLEATLPYTRHALAYRGDRLVGLGGVVYERTGATWSEPVTLPEPGFSASTFGWSADFAGDRIVVHRTPPGTDGALGLIDTYERSGGSWALVDELDVRDLRDFVTAQSHGAALVVVGDTLVATAVRPALLTVHRRSGDAWRRDFALSQNLPAVDGTATGLHAFQTSVAFDGGTAVGGWCVPRGSANTPDAGTAIVYEIP